MVSFNYFILVQVIKIAKLPARGLGNSYVKIIFNYSEQDNSVLG